MLKSRIFIRYIIEVATENIKGCSKVKSAFYFDDCFYLLLLEGTSLGLYKFLSVATVRLQCIWQHFGCEYLCLLIAKERKTHQKQKINTTRNIQTTAVISAICSWKQIDCILCKCGHSRSWWFFTGDTFVTISNCFCNPNTILGQNFLEIAGGEKCNQG